MSGIRIFFKTLKVFILFTGCTLLFYYGIMWVNQEYENYHRYDEPKGTAIKVNSTNQKDSNWINRLLLFYLDGE
ncbi:YqzK family protein [Bacillus sp. FJAT-49736]|uniref:YqzK family protein n=1 Tax=Bacillus sp. FJAT-49736 TaxID=2833582 RepID=UPI001BC9AB1A|nr:YqzK family protein [Bacillus sp. FJAT-49736]MBS4173345.1 YqzK family protein [Bacillus sp. FJAT-49736]